MAYEDALTDVCTIYSPSKSQNTAGEEEFTLDAEYEDEPCRIMKGSTIPGARQVPGQFEDPRDAWTMLLSPSVTGVQKRWRVECNGLSLVVTGTHQVRGDTSGVHHLVLFLQEKV